MKKFLICVITALVVFVLFKVFFYERKIVKCGSSRCVVSINKITGNAKEKIVESYSVKSVSRKLTEKERKEKQALCVEYYKKHCSKGERNLKCRMCHEEINILKQEQQQKELMNKCESECNIKCPDYGTCFKTREQAMCYLRCKYQ